MLVRDLLENGCIAPWTHIIIHDWKDKDIVCGGIDKQYLIRQSGNDEIKTILVNNNQLHITVEHYKAV